MKKFRGLGFNVWGVWVFCGLGFRDLMFIGFRV